MKSGLMEILRQQAVLADFTSSDTHFLATYTQVYMVSLGGYLVQYSPLFMLGAIFGKLMGDSGSARAISQFIAARVGPQRSTLAIVLSCAILTYGGASLFVFAFAVYPIASALFRLSGTPKRLIPGAIAFSYSTTVPRQKSIRGNDVDEFRPDSPVVLSSSLWGLSPKPGQGAILE